MEPTTAAAAAAATPAPSGASGMSIVFAMLVFFLLFTILSTRSQKKREAEQRKQINALKKGDKVVLLGGIIGTIVGFNQEILEVKVSENTKISVLPTGIVSILNGNALPQGDKK